MMRDMKVTPSAALTLHIHALQPLSTTKTPGGYLAGLVKVGEDLAQGLSPRENFLLHEVDKKPSQPSHDSKNPLRTRETTP